VQKPAGGVPPRLEPRQKGRNPQANERMIDAMPTGLIVFWGTGTLDDLDDKAWAFGNPVWDFRIRDPA
jgi:hypothetical protein